jgi:predicted phage replisome organizer
MSMESKKYYWLKLKRDFFKRHDIQIIEDLPNGKEYVLFYLKLLVESIDHEGELRFSETVPYNDQMLASITRTNIDIVRTAVKLFAELGMMDKLDDGTLHMMQTNSMLGDETAWAEKKRIYRDKKRLEVGQKRTLSDKSIELEKEIELEKDINTNMEPVNRKRFTKPTIEDIRSYCTERKNKVNPERFLAYYDANGWKVGKNAMKDWQAAIRTWETNGTNNSPQKSLPVHKQETMLIMPEDERPF